METTVPLTHEPRHATRRVLLRQAALLSAGLVGGLACAPSQRPTPAAATAPVVGSPPSLSSAVASASLASPVPSPSPSPAAVAAPSVVGQTYHVHGAWVALTSKALIWAVALEAGYFDKYGVDFQLDYINGSSSSAAAMVSGSVDMVATEGTAVVTAQAAGQDLIMVAGFINQMEDRIMALPEITTFDQLKGKPVAVTRIGQSDYLVWQEILRKMGWGPNDIDFVPGNDQAGATALLQQHQAFAVAATPPNELAAQQVGAYLLLDTRTLNIPYQDTGYVLPRTYLAQNHDASLAVLKASIEAIHRWQTDQTFTEQVFAKYLKVTDQAILDDGWSAYAPILAKEPYPTQDGLAAVIQDASTQNPAAAQLSAAQLMDASLVQEVVDSGFIQQVYGS